MEVFIRCHLGENLFITKFQVPLRPYKVRVLIIGERLGFLAEGEVGGISGEDVGVGSSIK